MPLKNRTKPMQILCLLLTVIGLDAVLSLVSRSGTFRRRSARACGNLGYRVTKNAELALGRQTWQPPKAIRDHAATHCSDDQTDGGVDIGSTGHSQEMV